MEPIHPNIRAKIISKYPDASKDLDEYERLLGSRFNQDPLKSKDVSNESKIKELHERLFRSDKSPGIEEEPVQEVLESIPPSGNITTDVMSDLIDKLPKNSYIGNLSKEEFLNGMTKTAEDLPQLFLVEWESIDLELREEYVDNLQWLLNAATLKLHDLEARLKIAEDKLSRNGG